MSGPQSSDGNTEAAACHQRGLDLLRNGNAALSITEFERAIKLAPANAEFHKNLGNARKATGDLEGAVASYRGALAISTDHLASHYNLGLTLAEMNRPEEAERHFRQVHALDPHDAEALFQLAALLADRLRFSESAEFYRKALQITPDNPYLWMGLGLACRGLPDRLEESIRCLGKCAELEPEVPDAHYQLGLACWKFGQVQEAVESYRRALALDPASHEAHRDLADILRGQDRLDEAAIHYQQAIRLSPTQAAAHSGLGIVFMRMNRLDDAIGSFNKAIELQPDLVSAHLNLGSTYGLTGARDQAIRCFEAALRLQPDSTAAAQCLLFEMQHVCDWSRLEVLWEKQRRSAADPQGRQVSSFTMLSVPLTPAEQLQCMKNFTRHQVDAVLRDRDRPRFQFERRNDTRIRIGYLSADFHEHATAYLMAELFELHDRRRFEIAAYSYGPDDGGPMRTRLKRAFDRFTDISRLSHTDAAGRIHSDRIDILVDLKGYTQFARPEIVALKPAPIQVNYLGYPGTMGADFIDYLITDRFVTPPGHERYFQETLAYLPGCYQVNDRARAIAATPSRSELDLPERSFVFCCLNQTFKIVPRYFAAWMRLLDAVPGSVLWLLESNRWVARNLQQEARKYGIAPERLMFAPMCPSARHIARMGAADLFLDTSPCNAHTTTSDALWGGLPVLTCPGETFASRVAGSVLMAANLPELVTQTLEAYEATALRLARNPDELIALRQRIAHSRATAPLFDTPSFARHLESAYQLMWENHLAGTPRQPIHV